MASVSSLDKDLKRLRLEKYTPAAANEARTWVETILGERLKSGDLLEGLKDGVALCKLANMAIGPPGIRFKQSAMPFVQMENISHFLQACKSPPLNLQEHDVFLTVDLFEQKDPAQVLQCLGAFSRAANSVNPAKFPVAIGSKTRGGVMSPQSTGSRTPAPLHGRGPSIASNSSSAYGGSGRTVIAPTKTGDSASGRWSPTKSPAKSPGSGSSSPSVSISSWSKREQEGATAPAWNIAQYGYMGGASQGNLGIAFGGRRQITSASPYVPGLADKERRRKEKEAEEERIRLETEEEERRRREEEERARLEEERRWELETRRLQEEERKKAEEERRKWEEEERMWKVTEEKRRQEEEAAEARLEEERRKTRSRSHSRLQGQYLSEYQAEQDAAAKKSGDGVDYGGRVKELEKELELARQREQEYERERQGRSQPKYGAVAENNARARSRSRPRPTSRQESWSRDEPEYLRTTPQPQQSHYQPPPQPTSTIKSPRPLPDPKAGAAGTPSKVKTHNTGSRPLPDPATAATSNTPNKVKTHNTGGRPLPNPNAYTSPAAAGFTSPPSKFSSPVANFTSPPAKFPSPAPSFVSPPAKYNSPTTTHPSPSTARISSPPQPQNRTDRFLASHPAPSAPQPQTTYSRELGATAERDAEDRRRTDSQAQTKASGWASKSLLEREMEMERQRQREWEDAQKETARAVRGADGVEGIGGGIGGRWDVSQWAGYTGGDNQNKPGTGIGAGRRQIVGPRPLPGPPR